MRLPLLWQTHPVPVAAQLDAVCAGVVAARARWAARLCIAACIGPGLRATELCLHGRAAAVEVWERTRAVVLAACAAVVRARRKSRWPRLGCGRTGALNLCNPKSISQSVSRNTDSQPTCAFTPLTRFRTCQGACPSTGRGLGIASPWSSSPTCARSSLPRFACDTYRCALSLTSSSSCRTTRSHPYCIATSFLLARVPVHRPRRQRCNVGRTCSGHAAESAPR